MTDGIDIFDFFLISDGFISMWSRMGSRLGQ